MAVGVGSGKEKKKKKKKKIKEEIDTINNSHVEQQFSCSRTTRLTLAE